MGIYSTPLKISMILNLAPLISDVKMYKYYVKALTQINIGGHVTFVKNSVLMANKKS